MSEKYTGTCYIGVVGPESENGVCRDSIHNIGRRNGDEGPYFIRATKGYEARQEHVKQFLSSSHSFILFLDHDQIFPSDTLERLRSHGLPYVSGYYMRRRFDPIAPVWFKYGPNGVWPMEPMTEDPPRGKLIKLGASGWGCVLVHRDVITAVRDILKGEQEVLEDDMDIWPYDLGRVLSALKGLQALVQEKPDMRTVWPALEQHTAVLTGEIRPLRGTKDPVGSDIRFPFFARQAGFTLWGDPDVRCGHMLNYPLSPDDYSGILPEQRQKLVDSTRRRVRIARREQKKRLEELGK